MTSGAATGVGVGTARLEAFTDCVLSIAITIMVLDLEVPAGGALAALRDLAPVLLAYALSFVNIGIYWTNHHQLMHAATRVDGWVLWANLHLLFWLSLVPFVIRWHDASDFSEGSTAAYGIVLGMSAVAYELLVRAVIRADGSGSAVAKALGGDRKGLGGVALYAIAIPLAYASRTVSVAIYVGVVLMWLVPDGRLVRALASRRGGGEPDGAADGPG